MLCVVFIDTGDQLVIYASERHTRARARAARRAKMANCQAGWCSRWASRLCDFSSCAYASSSSSSSSSSASKDATAAKDMFWNSSSRFTVVVDVITLIIESIIFEISLLFASMIQATVPPLLRNACERWLRRARSIFTNVRLTESGVLTEGRKGRTTSGEIGESNPSRWEHAAVAGA